VTEVEIHLALDHPNIVRVHDVYESPYEVSLVMECCTGGELFHHIVAHGPFPEQRTADITRQMLCAIIYLHAHHIVHRDLKPENILFETQDVEAPIKIIDFGFARYWDGQDLMKVCCGAIPYVSPEALSGKGYTNKCDLWSIGIIMFMMIAGCMPFAGDKEEVKQSLKKGQVRWQLLNETLKAWECGDLAHDLLIQLLACNPEERHQASTAIYHPWLIKLNPVAARSPILDDDVLQALQGYAASPKLRRAALQLLTEQLMPEEVRKLRDLFLALDDQTLGTISPKKLTDAITWSKSVLLQCVDPAGVLAALANTPGKQIYYSDFLAATWKAKTSRDEAIRAAFHRMDADKSGKINAADLRNVLGDTFEGTNAEDLLLEADPAGNGELSYESFVRVISQ